LDANVLIDFLHTGNYEVLSQFSEKIATITILDVIVGEVQELNELMVRESGMVFQKTDEDTLDAAVELASSGSALSFQDHCLFETACNLSYGIITGERKLITKAKEQSINTLRGFRLVYHLCSDRYISKNDGLSIVTKIVNYNPFFNKSHIIDFLDLFE